MTHFKRFNSHKQKILASKSPIKFKNKKGHLDTNGLNTAGLDKGTRNSIDIPLFIKLHFTF